MEPFVPGGDPTWGSGDLRRDLWTRPNPELAEIYDIFDYALTVDGYCYAREILHAELSERAEFLLKKWNGPKREELNFVELRLMLYWEQRCAHHCWQPIGFVSRQPDGTEETVWSDPHPNDDDLRHFRELNGAICKSWDREWPFAKRYLGVDR